MRACSSTDRCEDGRDCIGGRCESRTLPPAIAESDRIVLAPTQLAYAELGGEAALLLAFDLRGLELGQVLESHLVLRRPSGFAAGTIGVHRLTGPWRARSTPPADALALVGAPESEARLVATSSDLVRLQISSDSLRRDGASGWAVRFHPGLPAAAGAALAESEGGGPQLELYLRRPVNAAAASASKPPTPTEIHR